MIERLPAWLPASASVDLALLDAGLKPAARLQANGKSNALRAWARRNGYFMSSDRDGFAVLARQAGVARRALEIDRRPGRHTATLGRYLGYPLCCSRAAARVGDEGIDELHRRLSVRRFHGLFSAIDPAAYLLGSARLSHIPCSPRCRASLAIARRVAVC